MTKQYRKLKSIHGWLVAFSLLTLAGMLFMIVTLSDTSAPWAVAVGKTVCGWFGKTTYATGTDSWNQTAVGIGVFAFAELILIIVDMILLSCLYKAANVIADRAGVSGKAQKIIMATSESAAKAEKSAAKAAKKAAKKLAKEAKKKEHVAEKAAKAEARAKELAAEAAAANPVSAQKHLTDAEQISKQLGEKLKSDGVSKVKLDVFATTQTAAEAAKVKAAEAAVFSTTVKTEKSPITIDASANISVDKQAVKTELDRRREALLKSIREGK